MNSKLAAIGEQAALDLQAFIKEGEKKILEAWAEAEQQAELEETHPKLKLGFAITLDLDKDHMETALSFGVKYKLSKDYEIPDQDQVKLPLDAEEPTVRIRTGDHDTGEIPLSAMKKAVSKLKGN